MKKQMDKPEDSNVTEIKQPCEKLHTRPPVFKTNEVYLPVTAKQFEVLTNEILTAVNTYTAPNSFDGEYFAQIMEGTIHAMKEGRALVKKTDLFDGCMKRISFHLTHHICQEIREKIAKKTNPEASAMDGTEDTAGVPTGAPIVETPSLPALQ